MTGKAYMHQIKQKRREVNQLMRLIERDRTRASGVKAISYGEEKIQGGPIQDRMADIIAKVCEHIEILKAKIHELQMLEEDAVGYLVQLEEQYERILTYHYLEGKEWSEVTELMRYSNEKYVYEVKEKALEELTEVLNGTANKTY